ncbi:hypothetical protein [Paraburkholderia sediminicola]|uniref:hypothetical protein n=1 Tax=Paraburkholderia sediminicola TaxID=458836 RepID=UPI00105F6A35
MIVVWRDRRQRVVGKKNVQLFISLCDPMRGDRRKLFVVQRQNVFKGSPVSFRQRPVTSGLYARGDSVQRRLGDPERREEAMAIQRFVNEIGEVHGPEQPTDQFDIAVSCAQRGKRKMVFE